MKLLIVFASIFLVAVKAQESDTCHAHASELCRSGTDQWTEGTSCNAVYGNINGNKRNLQKIMTDHLKQSFQFIVMVSRGDIKKSHLEMTLESPCRLITSIVTPPTG